MRVNVVCRNYNEERIVPRMARALAQRLGWTVTAAPSGQTDILYLLGYFEAPKVGSKWPDVATAAYFTHREESPPGNAKSKQFDDVAKQVDLRVVMCALYGRQVEQHGPTIQPPLPVELDRFRPAKKTGRQGRGRVVVGLSGYTYPNHRKGEDLVKGIITSKVGQRVEWRASGRGWPVRTKMYSWEEMPGFYQNLDVLVCPSRVEGGPMPVLEALACGTPVIVPSGVGIIDELPDAAGIYRYARGDLDGLVAALERAVDPGAKVDREALRAAVAGHSVEGFCEAHRIGFEMLMDGKDLGEGAEERQDSQDLQDGASGSRKGTEEHERPEKGGSMAAAVHKGKRGVYCVAFGEPARVSARRLMESLRRHMPDVPIALCAATKIGPEDVLIVQPDSDIGGRRAKLLAYGVTPPDWKTVLYLDADTEVVAPVYQLFEWIEDGWDLAICTDVAPNDELAFATSKVTKDEADLTAQVVGTRRAIQFNGGVWAFGRNKRTKAFFERWLAEWDRFGSKDQCALLRALHAGPLKVLALGNEWNTFPKYGHGIQTAGILHFPGDARRWKGAIPGRIDSPTAWAAVRRFEGTRRGRRG